MEEPLPTYRGGDLHQVCLLRHQTGCGQIVPYPYNGTQLGNEKKGTTDRPNDMNESQKHDAEGKKKPDMKAYMSIIYMMF